METYFSQGDIDFRAEVSEFLDASMPRDITEHFLQMRPHTHEHSMRWQKVLADKGWAAPHWPVEFGGAGWSAMQQYIFEVEAAMRGAPRVAPFGIKMIGPVLIRYGTPEQQARYLPKILSGEEFWCQGFSEPGAGSDLASLKTRADRTNTGYRINGSKIWTTMAHEADFMFALVRTDLTAEKRQAGISMVIIDMKSPGLEVRPIHSIDGAHHVNEVFFEDVDIPAENLIGEENKGWGIAKFLLTNERVGIAQVGLSKAQLALVKSYAARRSFGGVSVLDDPSFATKLADLETDMLALEVTNLRMLEVLKADGDTAALSSLLKLHASEIRQRVAELAVEAAGPDAVRWDPDAVADPERYGMYSWLNSRATTIFGGSSEIMKNIVAKQVVGYA